MPLPERVGKQLYLHLRADALVEDIIYSVEDGHVDVIMTVFSFIHFVPKNPSAIISISICALLTLYPLPIIVPNVRLRENLEYPVTSKSPR